MQGCQYGELPGSWVLPPPQLGQGFSAPLNYKAWENIVFGGHAGRCDSDAHMLPRAGVLIPPRPSCPQRCLTRRTL